MGRFVSKRRSRHRRYLFRVIVCWVGGNADKEQHRDDHGYQARDGETAIAILRGVFRRHVPRSTLSARAGIGMSTHAAGLETGASWQPVPFRISK